MLRKRILRQGDGYGHWRTSAWLLLLALALVVMASSLGGCVTAASTKATRTVAQSVAQQGSVTLGDQATTKCEAAAFPASAAPGDVRAFAIAQSFALAACEERRATAARQVDEHNKAVAATVEAVKPRRWWEFWKGP